MAHPPQHPNTHFLGSVVSQTLIYPLLKLADAKAAAGAVYRRLHPDDYIHCNLQCEAKQPPFDQGLYVRGPMPAWVNVAPRHFLNYGQHNWPPGPRCPRQAKFLNLARADAAHPAGKMEPSYCIEPHGVPRNAVGSHSRPADASLNSWPYNQVPPLVCGPCKANRAADLEWRRENLRFGVCAACRKWAIANMQPGQNDCSCEPAGNCAGEHNNNEPRANHLCRFHDNHYWWDVITNTRIHIDWRRRTQRTQPKKKGHGWTKKKGQVGKTRTPAQRRKATRLDLPAPTQVAGTTTMNSVAWQPQPRCYCGEFIGAAGHVRQVPGGPQVETDRVRNCAGCNQFIRRW